MRWLLALYPRSWRERYGEEFAGLLEQERITPLLIFNVLGGALDAQVQLRRLGAPKLAAGAATRLRGGMMLTPRFRKIGLYTALGVVATVFLALFAVAIIFAVNLGIDLYHRDRVIFDAVMILTVAILIGGLFASGTGSASKPRTDAAK
jgi:hypothetical protein